MATQTKQFGVLFLERNRFQLYIASSETVVTYIFKPEIVNNIEIFKDEELLKELTDFAKQHAIPALELVMILSSTVLFEKDFAVDKIQEVPDFIKNVPFENVSSKTFQIQNGSKVIVANTDFYSSFQLFFEKLGSTIDTIIPEFALGSKIDTFSAATGRLILSRLDTLKQFNLEENILTPPIEKQVDSFGDNHPKRPNQSLLLMLPVFGILLLVLGFMVYKNYMVAPPKIKIIPTIAPTRAVSPTIQVVPTTPVASNSAILPADQVTITIITPQQNAAKATAIQKTLQQKGFKNTQITTSNVRTVNPDVLFSSSMPPEMKSSILEEVKKVFADVTVHEDQSVNSVVITL